ncbi:hypothetical protein B7P43_G17339 [Cryptotermes secundus]|uniref:KIND domain-containing protein n=1 Tax=Cryptotermes secundus TaxID=105785 RepID=A0A2J7REH9_9NEOP|nr:hypothetical protein B7P43_G17339 [Cryptotermes secundus]
MPEGRRPLERPRRRWLDSIKMDLRDIAWDGMVWIDLVQDRDQWIALVNTRCCNHLGAPSPQQADAHYRAVCRALVAEALELSSFLEKVSQGTQELRAKAEAASTDLDKLQFSDWVS